MKYVYLYWVFFLSVSSSQGAFCAQWQNLGFNQDLKLTIFYEVSPVKKSSNAVLARVLYNYDQPSIDLKIRHFSELETLQFDCKKFQFQLQSVDWYDAPMGQGAVVWHTQNLETQTVPPAGTAYDKVFRIACKK
jgi:hypothetical protein